MHDNWDELLDDVEFATNKSWHESTHGTPFLLNAGQHVECWWSIQWFQFGDTLKCAAISHIHLWQETVERACRGLSKQTATALTKSGGTSR